jgi:hypothetical protein
MPPRVSKANTGSGSTTWDYEPRKLSPARREGKPRVPKGRRWGSLRRRNPREKLTLTISYRGGAEAWWLIEARGSSGVFPGVAALHDVMREILSEPRNVL